MREKLNLTQHVSQTQSLLDRAKKAIACMGFTAWDQPSQARRTGLARTLPLFRAEPTGHCLHF